MEQQQRSGGAVDMKPYAGREFVPPGTGDQDSSIPNTMYALDDCGSTPGSAATFMRPDDYVLGIVANGKAKAYPLGILNYYHLVNDSVGEKPVAIFA